MNPFTKTANQQTYFKQQKAKVLTYCNLSDSNRLQTSTNHIAAIHLVFEKNENFWLVKSVRVDRAEDMERKKLVWSK